MRALHKINEGRYARHPSIVEVLFVGPNPRGKRGGTSGNPVDAVDVARRVAAQHPAIIALTDETLVAIRQHIGRPLEFNDIKRLEKAGVSLGAFALRTLVAAGKLKEALA